MRWFLNRSRALLSALTSIRRSRSRVPGRRQEVVKPDERASSSSRREHLYLILDDTRYGFGIHKVYLDDDKEKPIIKKSTKQEEDPWDLRWCESTGFGQRPSRWVWSSHQEPLPFHADELAAHAVHPGGRAFAVSVYSYRDQRLTADLPNRGTFSYDTDLYQWTRHGDWELPFGGQAHYHTALGAWIGLHVDVRDGGGRISFKEPDGYLCSCDVPALGVCDAPAPPHWRLGREKLFLHDPEERHLDAKLVSMGGERFCLVEFLTRDNQVDTEKNQHLGDGDKCVLRLTTFRVKYEDGELVTTSRRPPRSYRFSKYNERFHPQAFWI